MRNFKLLGTGKFENQIVAHCKCQVCPCFAEDTVIVTLRPCTFLKAQFSCAENKLLSMNKAKCCHFQPKNNNFIFSQMERRQYRCEYIGCNKVYTQKGKLTFHIKVQHNADQNNNSDMCSKAFSTLYALRDNTAAKHNDELKLQYSD